MNRIVSLFFLVLVVLVSSCNQYGKKVTYGKTDIYYTSTVSETEAENLGAFLERAGFNKNRKAIALQLSKYKDIYRLKVIQKDEYDMSYETEAALRNFARTLSEYVFAGAPVKLYLCDKSFKVLRSMEAEEPLNYEIAE